MRRTWVILLFGFAPAIVVAFVVLLIGIAARPPKYTALATFSVNWNSMPSVPNDEKAQKVRDNWRKKMTAEIIGLPDSKDGISDILDRAGGLNIGSANRAAAAAALKQWLRIRLTSQTNDCDLFTVEMRGRDTNSALTTAGWVLHGTVSKLNTEAQAARTLATLRSRANVDGIIQTKSDLQEEAQKLKREYSRPYPDAVEQRLSEIESRLNDAEFDHAEAGLGMLANLGGMFFNDSVKVVQEVHVVRSDASYGAGVVLAAAAFGCMAGALVLGLRLIIPKLVKSKPTVGSAPPKLSTPPLANLPPPLAGQPPPAKPPVLTPPRL